MKWVTMRLVTSNGKVAIFSILCRRKVAFSAAEEIGRARVPRAQAVYACGGANLANSAKR